MCGIAGVLRASGRRDGGRWIRSANTSLERRGPNDVGYLGWSSGARPCATRDVRQVEDDACILLHRRLSILDTSTCGWQPMQSADGRFSIVFNGEIYNYLELRAELERAGATFQSRSDTEVLLELYARLGKDALLRCVGMFALAILDLQRRCLFLARDYFGIKPLYYTLAGGQFAFASEPAALLDLEGVSHEVRADGLYDYLRFGITDAGSTTLWRDVQQLPAAHFMEVPLDLMTEPQLRRFWSIPPYEPRDIGFREASEELRALFLDSVRLHLRSDVPLGSCLSGGIDSSAIVMGMRRQLGPEAPIHTFSYVASDERVSEEKWMRLVSDGARTSAHYTRPTENDLIAALPDLIRCQGEPFGSTSIYAQYAVFQAAAERGMTVMLDGQGADELLGGYWNFLAARIASLVGTGHLWSGARLFRRGARYPGITAGRLASMAVGTLVPASVQALGRQVIGRSLTPSWLSAAWLERQGVRTASPWRRNGPHHLYSQLQQSLESVSLPMLLRYEDRNSMRFSIESRVPFLTHRIAELILSLPESYIVNDAGERKSVFRAAMRGIVPDAILDRRDKIGFQTSESQWLRRLAPWVREVLGNEVAHAIPAFDHAAVSREYEAFVAGQRPLGAHVWRWINVILWAQEFGAVFQR